MVHARRVDSEQAIRIRRGIRGGQSITDDRHIVIEFDSMLARGGEWHRVSSLIFICSDNTRSPTSIARQFVSKERQVIKTPEPKCHVVESWGWIFHQNELMMFPLI